MIEEKTKGFEEVFNEWYKKFLEEEAKMNDDIKEAKKYREEKLTAAKKEALDTIKIYEEEQNDKLQADIEKLTYSKNTLDKMDAEYHKEVELIHKQNKQNKDKVIDYLIKNVMSIELVLPASLTREGMNKIPKK